MRSRIPILRGALFWLAIICSPEQFSLAQTLRFVTINVWSGLDYHGVSTVGEYEPTETREMRFRILVEELRSARPDVVALQELNPVGKLASRLSEELGYDVIWQRANSGIKLASVGVPWNLNEGLAILARKDFQLQLVDVWDLSKAFGIFGNGVSFHFSDQNIALVGRLNVGDSYLYVINTHCSSGIPADSMTEQKPREILVEQKNDEAEIHRDIHRLKEKSNLRQKEVEILTENIKTYLANAPIVLLGDFNATPDLPEIRFLTAENKFLDILAVKGMTEQPTWDAEHNTNIRFSQQDYDARGNRLSGDELLSAWYDRHSRRIDYIFLDSKFVPKDVLNAAIFLNTPLNGLFASDHYAVLADIDVSNVLKTAPDAGRAIQSDSEIETLPILSYDTDVGFGYGAKAFFLNQFSLSESFDIVAFNSTKGERWYRFVFSVPDFELRQGKVYPVSIDFVIDYDKWINNSFFGIGSGAKFEDRETYSREPFEVSLALSRGFSPHTVGQVGIKYKTVKNSHFSESSRLLSLSPSMNALTASYNSVFANYRYDTRNSYINPSDGMVLQGEIEYAPESFLSNVELKRLAATVQHYSTLFYPKTVLALRLGLQGLLGDEIPVQLLLPIGGNQTLRGSPQDRFLDKIAAVFNAELRIPLVWRFGAIIGIDAGKVWESAKNIDLTNWAMNPTVGLRLHMDTFVVRADLGFGSEVTGFYLNFGQLF